MNPKELVCREFVELVSDYLEDALSPADKARFEKHLRECDGCERYLDQMRITIESVGSLSVEKMQPETMDEFLHAFRDWHSES
ncbi:MAG: zf-HC2 domain-containing protein [Acidobacteria bacterium]|nr:zf-HC2 domain-containing protein [Acidobacteriota bacterium]MDA1236034.1 zf-HC2 domain-containing protein [Acidobacteriota bacterium]